MRPLDFFLLLTSRIIEALGLYVFGIIIVGIDNEYVLEKAQIASYFTLSRKPFYERLGYKCKNIHGNKLCVFEDTY